VELVGITHNGSFNSFIIKLPWTRFMWGTFGNSISVAKKNGFRIRVVKVIEY